MPDRPSDRQLAPWEAVLAQALQQDEPERTALEVIQQAQDFTTHTGHLLELMEAFWRLDVVPKIDEMVRQRITPAEYERYRRDPERPAFLQALREHEIGGRRIEDVLDSITAEPLDGLRSIAAGLHGRAGKEPAPARGMTAGWAERAPRDPTPEIETGARMADARQAELGRRLAGRPEAWALDAWGGPPTEAESAARRADWEKQAGTVASYREAAGVTDPQQALGPVPAGKAHLAEAFRASVRALQLPDEAALLKAMGRGELEAAVDEHDRAAALAPPDVQAEVGERESELEAARVRAHMAGFARDAEAEAEAQASAEAAAEDLARLAVADAARREWTEAHAGQAARAEAAGRELRHRNLAKRIPVTDAEVAAASAQERPFPVIDPAEAARWRAEQTAQVEAARQARREAAARTTPVTDAEIARYGAAAEPEAEPEAGAADSGQGRAEIVEEIRQEIKTISAKVDQLPDPAAERRAEMEQAGIDEPVVHEPQAEPTLEASWQPGSAQAQHEPQPEQDAEPEMEIG